WVKACLNCNTNYASVDFEVAGAERFEALSAIDNAFDRMHSLLAGAGALNTACLAQAIYVLKLEIAIAH
ncbi:hypothetical protein ACSMCS_22735, partial [Salmonella enterica]|uniref:hypothetical protein n=1 Tax=Salmonella enterica TaxID=28901 RepID=UPI003F1ABFC4